MPIIHNPFWSSPPSFSFFLLIVKYPGVSCKNSRGHWFLLESFQLNWNNEFLDTFALLLLAHLINESLCMIPLLKKQIYQVSDATVWSNEQELSSSLKGRLQNPSFCSMELVGKIKLFGNVEENFISKFSDFVMV